MKTIFKVFILECAEYQLLWVFNVWLYVALIMI